MKIYILSCALVALIISGCGSHKANTQNRAADINQHNAEPFDPAKHVISIDPDGKLKPCKEENAYLICQENSTEQDTYFKNIIAAIDTFKKEKNENGEEAELLFFVHGGLNDEPKALERAQKIYKKIRGSKKSIYPIFVIWESGGISSYRDHLWKIRQGEEGNFAKWTSPIYFLSDIGNSIVNTPKSWIVTGKHLWDSAIRESIDDKNQILNKEICLLKQEGLDVNIKPNNYNKGNISRNIRWMLTSPAKVVTTPFAYTMPKSAWDVMLRRTDTLFYTPCELQDEDADNCKKKGWWVKSVDT